MAATTNRREFMKSGAAWGLGMGLGVRLWTPHSALGANERLDIGVIGVGGRGSANLASIGG